MIRTALLIYAASMLAGASLAVGAVNGRFVGDTEAGPMVAELATGRDGELSGTLRCGEIIAPLTAPKLMAASVGHSLPRVGGRSQSPGRSTESAFTLP